MANIWKMFADLIPDSPTLIGKVISHSADGYSILEMPGGGIMKAKGISVDIGKVAFVQSNEVSGEAPNLPLYEISV